MNQEWQLTLNEELEQVEEWMMNGEMNEGEYIDRMRKIHKDWKDRKDKIVGTEDIAGYQEHLEAAEYAAEQYLEVMNRQEIAVPRDLQVRIYRNTDEMEELRHEVRINRQKGAS